MIRDVTVTLESALAASIGQDNAVVLEQFINEVEDVNMNLKTAGLTMLHIAAKSGAINCARLILDHQGDPNSVDYKGLLTPLHSVASSTKNSAELCKILLSNGANTNHGDTESVIHTAVRENNYEMVKYLVENDVATEMAETSLHTAAENNCLEILKLLLEKVYTDIDLPNSQEGNETALHIAAEAGYEDVVKELLSNGANIRKVNNQHMTALHLAAKNLHATVIQVLLEHKSSEDNKMVNMADKKLSNIVDNRMVNMVDNQGRTALFVCTSSKGRGATKCMNILLRFGADPDIQNQDGFTALHVAAIGKESVFSPH